MVVSKNGGGHTAEKGIREIRIFFNQCNFTDFEPKVLRYHPSKWKVCKSIDTGNQDDHQNTAEIQKDLCHCLTSNARCQSHTGTQASLGSAHPSRQKHTGTQALLGSAQHSGQQGPGPNDFCNTAKGFTHAIYLKTVLL